MFSKEVGIVMSNSRYTQDSIHLDRDVALYNEFAVIKDYIKRNCSDNSLSLRDVSQYLSIPKNRVHYVLRKLNTSFRREIKLARLEFAREMILRKDRKVLLKQVAYYSGFKTLSHFSSSYKRAFGYPPSEEQFHSGCSFDSTVDPGAGAECCVTGG